MARSPRILTLSVLAAGALLASACDGPSGIISDLTGAGQAQDAPLPGDNIDPEQGRPPVDNIDPEQGRPPIDNNVDPTTGYRQVANRADLGSPAPRPIDDLVGDAASDEIRVRFTAQAGECTIQNASAIEFDDRVEITLLEGLHPNVAAMTCMNLQEQQEIVLTLDAPLGVRELVAADGSDLTPPVVSIPDNPGAIDAASYVGLPILDATERAQNEGWEWRVMREDDEFFAGTADYRTDRLNFEIDDGVVTVASVG